MIKLYDGGVYLVNGTEVVPEAEAAKVEALTGKSPNKDKFDAMASHDITFVGIVQTARASGMEKFPLPYVLTNCHNTLCAVGGTINEDDHMFGLSAAKKYGGIYVPPHIAVIHQYMREMHAGCGKMILGSDSHTRYGALDSSSKTLTMSPTPASWPSTSTANPSPSSARRTLLLQSSARSSRTASSRTRSWNSSAPASRA